MILKMNFLGKLKNRMKLFIKILLFVFVALVTNVKVVSAIMAFPNIQEATAYSSFHNEITNTIYKVIINDEGNCCKNGNDLVDYRNRGKGVQVVAAKGGGKSVNQLNKAVQTGKAPKGIIRFDKGRGTKNLPQDEVHFKDGSSLYRDGTWRHNKGHNLTNDQIKFLKENGWNIP